MISLFNLKQEKIQKDFNIFYHSFIGFFDKGGSCTVPISQPEMKIGKYCLNSGVFGNSFYIDIKRGRKRIGSICTLVDIWKTEGKIKYHAFKCDADASTVYQGTTMLPTQEELKNAINSLTKDFIK